MILKKKHQIDYIKDVNGLYRYTLSLEGKSIPTKETFRKLKEKLEYFLNSEKLASELRYCRFIIGLIEDEIC